MLVLDPERQPWVWLLIPLILPVWAVQRVCEFFSQRIDARAQAATLRGRYCPPGGLR